MSKSNFNLRGIPANVMCLLKKEAKKRHISVNSFILKIIERSLGYTHEKHAFHDLDHLAGSWSATEEKMFNENTQWFKQIDKGL